MISYSRTDNLWQSAEHSEYLSASCAIAQVQRSQRQNRKSRKVFAKQCQRLAITAKHNLMPLCLQPLNERHTAGSMTQSPVQRCYKYAHNLSFCVKIMQRYNFFLKYARVNRFSIHELMFKKQKKCTHPCIIQKFVVSLHQNCVYTTKHPL